MKTIPGLYDWQRHTARQTERMRLLTRLPADRSVKQPIPGGGGGGEVDNSQQTHDHSQQPPAYTGDTGECQSPLTNSPTPVDNNARILQAAEAEASPCERTGPMDAQTEGSKYWQKVDAQADKLAKRNATVEDWQRDAASLAGMVNAIMADKRLSWEVVSRWLTDHHKLMVDEH